MLFPTREETVAALSRHRERLLRHYRVPTAQWDVVDGPGDPICAPERSAFRRCATCSSRAVEMAAVDGKPPFVVKPAVKEALLLRDEGQGVAGRAAHTQLRELVDRALQVMGRPEVGKSGARARRRPPAVRLLRAVQGRAAAGEDDLRRRRQHPPEFGRASTYVETVDAPELEEMSNGSCGASATTSSPSWNTSAIRATRAKLLDVNARTWGYHTLGERAGSTSPPFSSPTSWASVCMSAARERACAGCDSRPTSRPPFSSWRAAGLAGEATCARSSMRTRRRCSTPAIPCPASSKRR